MCKCVFVATSHGNYAKETVKTLEMLTGEQMLYISFKPNQSKENLKNKYYTLIEQVNNNPIVFIVDIFSGTPFNALIEIKGENIEWDITLITGLSLTMLIELTQNGLNDDFKSNLWDLTKIISTSNFDFNFGEEEN